MNEYPGLKMKDHKTEKNTQTVKLPAKFNWQIHSTLTGIFYKELITTGVMAIMIIV